MTPRILVLAILLLPFGFLAGRKTNGIAVDSVNSHRITESGCQSDNQGLAAPTATGFVWMCGQVLRVYTIQVTVGWTDSHLFEFVVDDRVYSNSSACRTRMPV